MPGSTDLELRLGFLALGSADLKRLAALRPLFEKHASALVDAFYQHLISFSKTRRFLVDPQVRERLIRSQRDYLLSLAGPKIDDEYLAQRRSIGEIHERIGLEPRWYLGAYALYLSLLVPLIQEFYAQDPAEAGRAIVALHHCR